MKTQSRLMRAISDAEAGMSVLKHILDYSPVEWDSITVTCQSGNSGNLDMLIEVMSDTTGTTPESSTPKERPA
jgi:hypothetical protein